MTATAEELKKNYDYNNWANFFFFFGPKDFDGLGYVALVKTLESTSWES